MKKIKKSVVAILAIIIASLGITTAASASSAFGMSANTTKANYSYSTDTEVTTAVLNSNDYPAGCNLIAQHYENGKWVDLDWNSPNPLDPKQKAYDSTTMNYFYGKTGTFRYKVEVDRYDSVTGEWLYYVGTFYTSNFYITK